MSSLEIHEIEGKGNLETECVWLRVNENIPDLSHYIICDTTYTDDKHISNELRHMYWFHKREVKKGDWIKLFTKNGKNTSILNEKGINTHFLYWNLNKTVWNKEGDAAVLFQLKTWNTKRA